MKQNILRKKLIQIFKKNKLSSSHAKTVSDYLIKAEILDASSHGLARLKMYCDRMRKKVINPKPKIKIKKISSSISHIDADNSICLLYTSPSPRDVEESRMPSSA